VVELFREKKHARLWHDYGRCSFSDIHSSFLNSIDLGTAPIGALGRTG
jgi:hypothetical protein